MLHGLNNNESRVLKLRRFSRMLLAALCLCCFAGCSFGVGTFSLSAAGGHRREAEKLKTEGKLREAIEQYEQHIAERRGADSKFPGENPSFYYIMIGDLYLKLEEPERALDAYLKAYEDGVMPEFVVDRLRQVSAYYEGQQLYQQAIELLTKYRELDSLLFDWDIDRLHKKIIQKEVGPDSFSLGPAETDSGD